MDGATFRVGAPEVAAERVLGASLRMFEHDELLTISLLHLRHPPIPSRGHPRARTVPQPMQCTARIHHVARRICVDAYVVRRYASSVTARNPKARLHRVPEAPQQAAAAAPPPPPQPSSPPPSPPHTRSRAVPLLFSSLLAGGIAFYAAQLYVAAHQPCTNPAIASLAAQKDVSARYDYTADGFDGEVGLSEMLMGVNRLRQSLARKCHGHVLEVSCGTGRNLGYYDIGPAGAVASLTFVDLSPQMVDVCRKKWDVLLGKHSREKLRHGLLVRFLPGSALEAMPSAPTTAATTTNDAARGTTPGSGKYDTIIQTMGLCSTPAPVELLANTVQYLDMSKEDSRILLLEHGRSYQAWLNNILDNAAEKHAEIHGCWFNRDIGALVAEAAEKTGLEIVNERRHHLGTTWVFELKPKAGVQSTSTVAAEGKVAESAGGSSWLRWK